MSTTYGATGLGQSAVSTRRVSSFFMTYWGAFQERRKRQCDHDDEQHHGEDPAARQVTGENRRQGHRLVTG